MRRNRLDGIKIVLAIFRLPILTHGKHSSARQFANGRGSANKPCGAGICASMRRPARLPLKLATLRACSIGPCDRPAGNRARRPALRHQCCGRRARGGAAVARGPDVRTAPGARGARRRRPAPARGRALGRGQRHVDGAGTHGGGAPAAGARRTLCRWREGSAAGVAPPGANLSGGCDDEVICFRNANAIHFAYEVRCHTPNSRRTRTAC